MKRIIFVCTGNTCRSPMAEIIAKDIFNKHKINIDVMSRGIAVYFPSEASENSIKALEKYNLDLSKHTAKQIEQSDIVSSNLILTMTNQHKSFVKKMAGDSVNVFTLKEYIKVGNDDISDPYGGDISDYQKCADELYSYIEMLADLLQ